MAQSVERVLGKDEVPGSNPGISSKKRLPKGQPFFLYFFPVYPVIDGLPNAAPEPKDKRQTKKPVYAGHSRLWADVR